MTVKLQGIYNKQEAKAVKELKTGDVIMWNYGYTSTVVDLIPSKTGKFSAFFRSVFVLFVRVLFHVLFVC